MCEKITFCLLGYFRGPQFQPKKLCIEHPSGEDVQPAQGGRPTRTAKRIKPSACSFLSTHNGGMVKEYEAEDASAATALFILGPQRAIDHHHLP